jgi:HlyD family secretion protein
MKLIFNRTILFAIIVVCIVGIILIVFKQLLSHPSPFQTVPVTRGDLRVTISATGTIEPEEVIDVGAQVAGRIVVFGKDKNGKTIDYGSEVEEGTVLAQIDDAIYAAETAQEKALLEQAGAGVVRAEADLNQMKAKLYQAKRDWDRAQQLGPSDALSQSDFDAAQSAYEIAKANVDVGKAAIVQAKKTFAQAEASLKRAERFLSYCTIRSPVKGVIIDRRVNIGQTVVASLNAPSLFLIAQDLKRMQVWVSVNEADIGNISPGQPATFTVDAYPGVVFKGEVGKVRLNATMTQNVVTYTVEIITDNSDGKLLPYLTANVQFELSNRRNVLLVPNSALRWFPQPEQMAKEFRAMVDGVVRSNGNGSEHQSKAVAEQAGNKSRQGLLWVRDGNYVRPINVNVGSSDGTMTEIEGNEVKEGLEAIVGEQQHMTDEKIVSPFTPQTMRSK